MGAQIISPNLKIIVSPVQTYSSKEQGNKGTRKDKL
jgi:hypothetical protein